MQQHRRQELKEMPPEEVLSTAIRADFSNPRKPKEKRNGSNIGISVLCSTDYNNNNDRLTAFDPGQPG